jgi:hypothetical protein
MHMVTVESRSETMQVLLGLVVSVVMNTSKTRLPDAWLASVSVCAGMAFTPELQLVTFIHGRESSCRLMLWTKTLKTKKTLKDTKKS